MLTELCLVRAGQWLDLGKWIPYGFSLQMWQPSTNRLWLLKSVNLQLGSLSFCRVCRSPFFIRVQYESLSKMKLKSGFNLCSGWLFVLVKGVHCYQTLG